MECNLKDLSETIQNGDNIRQNLNNVRISNIFLLYWIKM